MASAAAGLLILSPVFALAALWIALRDGRPVLFSQMRVGRHGRLFRIWKFRTMRAGAAGSALTAAGDERITTTGEALRKYKLDELPQLWNVLRGDMSLVGPRPEVAEYVDTTAPVWQAVLQVRPGITDVATLLYRHEERLLGGCANADEFYRQTILPEKLRCNLNYLRTRSLRRDLMLIWLTVRYSLWPELFDPVRIRRIFGMEKRHDRDLYSFSSAVNR